MFKRRTARRPDDRAEAALRKVLAQDEAMETAVAAHEEGRAHEAAGDDEAAVAAYLRSAAAWEARFRATGYGAPAGPYERLAILLRRAKEPDAEAAAIERYIAHAGRDVHPGMLVRLERVRELQD